MTTAAGTTKAPLDHPPESFRPDRPEKISTVGNSPKVELAPDVGFECLVGQFNAARDLTTGLVTMAAGAELEYHTHPCTESVTVLSGTVTFDVEGRRYTLGELDNVVIPAGLAHACRCTAEVKLHVALATSDVTRDLIDDHFTVRLMPDDSTGVAGAERVTRIRTAERSEAGPGTSFVDYFNAALMPGLEMSGGYGEFSPGGRLPAHIHDFDESICITDGVATCVVEGRRYELSHCATALQPRGRVHYFINNSRAPMAMVWVYAGPMPERIVVAESCATAEGNPWK
jgi:quercetin dioxygenase-like cupin family protein